MAGVNMNKIGFKNWAIIWVLGMAGQICWNVENSWFNTFVYEKIAPNPYIISWMVGVSAFVTTFATFLIGTSSDRAGKRKPFIAAGYILWGVFTIAFGATQYLPKNPLLLAAVVVVAADAIMSFFGSMGYDGAFNPWTTDISNEHNRGRLGGAFATMPVLATIFGAVVSGILIDAIDFFMFFVVMGALVSLCGVATLFVLKDAPDLKPRRNEGGYWSQFFSVFRFKTVTSNHELFWVFIIMVVYFIGFNVYFPYITIYFTSYIGLDYTMTGILQGVGLLAAVALTIPAAKYIEGGKAPSVIMCSIIASCAGMLVIFFNKSLIPLFIGVFGTGLGYVLMVQTLTAWYKNLCPADQRGQFEGVNKIFSVCLPMLIGPAISSPVINSLGVRKTVNGVEGMVPSEAIFLIAMFITVLTVLPLIPANRLFKNRKAGGHLQE